MKQFDTDDSRQPAFVVRQDAAEQHKKYWPLFSADKQAMALKVKELARLTYFRSKIYLTARDKFIAVKVDRPSKADELQQAADLANLKTFTDANGIEPIATKNNLLFRIPK